MFLAPSPPSEVMTVVVGKYEGARRSAQSVVDDFAQIEGGDCWFRSPSNICGIDFIQFRNGIWGVRPSAVPANPFRKD